MADKVYKKIEVVGTSRMNLEDAIQNAVAKSAKSIRELSWFEVDEIRGRIEEDNVTQWQVTVRIGFAVDE
ncbi:MAG: dodecin family protein [Anaerolineae bacterium]|jgi:flavin-binding protein dodecin